MVICSDFVGSVRPYVPRESILWHGNVCNYCGKKNHLAEIFRARLVKHNSRSNNNFLNKMSRLKHDFASTIEVKYDHEETFSSPLHQLDKLSQS